MRCGALVRGGTGRYRDAQRPLENAVGPTGRAEFPPEGGILGWGDVGALVSPRRVHRRVHGQLWTEEDLCGRVAGWPMVCLGSLLVESD